MTADDEEAVAGMLRDYLRHRAGRDCVSFTPDAAFFRRHLRAGIRDFFGIEVDGVHLARDRLEPMPGFLTAWKVSRLN